MKRQLIVCAIVAAAVAYGLCVATASALVPDGAHGWFWQMPQPAAGLNDIAFPTAHDVWAVGGAGLILRSADAGATWNAQSTGTDADLWSVSFVDGLHGWVCGGEPTTTSPGVIMATANGGGTWQDVTPAGLTESVTNVSFGDRTHGWVGTASGILLNTANGGTSWRRLRIGGYKESAAVDFVDATHGWVGGTRGRIWRTTNGGKTWAGGLSNLPSFLQIVQIDFVDRQHGWALAWSNYYGSMVVTTYDGGRSWYPVSTGNPLQIVTGLRATSPTSIWLVGFTWDFMSAATPTTLSHSVDGGFHWRTWSMGTPVTPWVIAGKGASVCAVGDGILASPDAGTTWKTTTSGQEYLFTGAQAVGGSDIWAVDYNGALLHSSDGLRWAEQNYPMRWTDLLSAVSFPDTQNGWAVGAPAPYMGMFMMGGSVVLHTGDGGATWSPQQSVLSGPLVGVDFVDDQNGWAISGSMYGDFTLAPVTIEHTTDGGANWRPQYMPGNTPLTAIDFLDSTTGWVAGRYLSSASNAAIYHTTDSGFSWTRETLPANAPALTALQFVDSNSGWAVGTSYDYDGNPIDGWVLHTVNGGTTWTRVPGLADTLAMTIHFVDPLNGWIGGLNGVYATTDGGVTWRHVASGYAVEAIAATDTSHAWAFGDNFLVSTVDGSGDTAAPATLNAHLDSGYSRRPVTLALSANDIGGSGLLATQYSVDGGTWRNGPITIPAPKTHSNDGSHTVLYRSVDNAGNREAIQTYTVNVDTLGPACYAPLPSVVNAGKQGILYFRASDATSGVAQATITLVNSRHHVVARYVQVAGEGDSDPSDPFYWFRFTCNLKPGKYRIEVRATDLAGNPQCLVGRNWLRVVRSGAPDQYVPDWGSGLPIDSFGFGPRFSRSLRTPWARGPFMSAAAMGGSHLRVWKYIH